MSESNFAEAVDQTVAAALLRRAAYRRPGEDLTHLPAAWRSRSRDMLAWKYRTHFGIFITGLIAKASDGSMNPLCLKVAEDRGEAGRFNPTAVWQTFYRRAVQAGVSTNGLKSAPHNNATYWRMGDNIAPTTVSSNRLTIDYVHKVHTWLEEVSQLSQDEASEALDAFLVEVPDQSINSELELMMTRVIKPDEAFVAIEEFIVADTENGRRGQAFMVACLNLIHGDEIETPDSVNDPSRASLGDATLRRSGKLQGIEAKQKLVSAAHIRDTALELARRAEDASLVYGALANGLDGKPLAENWRDITRSTGVLTVIHDGPATMLRDAIIASGKPFTDALLEVCENYYSRLAQIGAKEATLQEWLAVMETLGVRRDIGQEDSADA